MNRTQIKSVVRSCRAQLMKSASLRARFKQGRRVAVLIPTWLESEHPDLMAFLMANGCGYHEAKQWAKVGEMYQLVPQWAVWKKLGYSAIRSLRHLAPEDMTAYLLSYGFDAVTLLGMVSE